MKKITATLTALLILICSTIPVSAFDLFLIKNGDADVDGKVTAEDARLILRTSVGLHTPVIFFRPVFDTDCDGDITASDARKALRIAVGLEKNDSSQQAKEKQAQSLMNAVSSKELKGLMTDICAIGSRSVIYPKNNLAAEKYITESLTSYGYKVFRQGFTYAGLETANVIATLNKDEKHKDIVLIATHYDCWDGASGAVDNASGVATLLHIAKLLKSTSIKFDKEIRLAFFSAEEMGYHGAYHYLSRLSEDEKSRISVYNLDMTGRSALGGGEMLVVSTEPVTGSYIPEKAQGNKISVAVDKAKSIIGNMGEKKYYSPVAAGRHDIVPFRQAGIPSVTLSWREIRSEAAYGSDYNLAPPSQIHTKLDTLENFDFVSHENTTKLIIASLIFM